MSCVVKLALLVSRCSEMVLLPAETSVHHHRSSLQKLLKSQQLLYQKRRDYGPSGSVAGYKRIIQMLADTS